MRHWNLRRGLLGGTASLLCVVAWVLLGCGNDSDETVISGGVVNLAAADGAALAGLTFAFPDATIFGFPGEAATLEVGDAAATFTLTTSGGTMIHGTIAAGANAAVSCRLTQHLQEVGAGYAQVDEEYDACQAAVNSQQDIAFGASGAGTVTLSFGRTGAPAVVSGPQDVLLHLHEDGTVTINNNATPI
jgi:hypothetical protein